MAEEPELPLLAEPAEPATLVASRADYLAMVRDLSNGSGPLAIDAERAHGHRYFTWAYLVQFRRAGAGTFLLDPMGLGQQAPAQLPELAEVAAECRWILHASTQDLPCLAELGLHPQSLFDTELAARLLGWPKVGLSTLVARICGVRLAKEHQAADWSTRPIPESWLTYAALDVELLADLQHHLSRELATAGREEWAAQEFEWLRSISNWSKPAHPEPWRRLSHLSSVRTPRGLAVARELWLTRDDLARRLDKPPSKVLQDVAIVEFARQEHPDPQHLLAVEGFRRRVAKRFRPNWEAAITRALELPRRQLPARHGPTVGLPAPRNWQRRHPEEYTRFLAAREVVNTLAGELHLPPEVLLQPDAWHHLCWKPPLARDPESVDAALAARGARPWQRDLAAGPLSAALIDQP